MISVYHGTDRQTATQMVSVPNFIDRTRGGGELGMGFYAGDSVAIAAAFAQSKFPFQEGVVRIDIEDTDLAKLQVHLVKRRERVFLFWRRIIRLGQRFSYLFGKDIVVAPFATIDICMQYKFESERAEVLVNACPKKLL